MARNIAIKVARAEKDMTQKEQGEENPTIKLCRSICRVLGKSLDDLFWEEE